MKNYHLKMLISSCVLGLLLTIAHPANAQHSVNITNKTIAQAIKVIEGNTGNTFSGESISIGYDMDAAWLRVAGIQGMNFRVYMNDIFRISSFKEERGLDYPFARSLSFSLGVRF